jgi:alpha-glucosidase
VLIGEIYLPLTRLMHYYGPGGLGVHLPFNFQLIDAPWDARSLTRLIAEYEAALPPGAWPNWVLGNHDRPRIAARLGEEQARVAAMLLLTLRGTPTLYYGDELGIGHVDIPPARVQDPRELREPGLGLGRDPVRTPMPWDATTNAGFSSAAPWLPLNPDWLERNVARLAEEPGSSLTFQRRLLALRRACPALVLGELALIEGAGDVLAYERRTGEQRLLVALNLGSTRQELALPTWAQHAKPLLSTIAFGEPARAEERLTLRPDEGLVLSPVQGS